MQGLIAEIEHAIKTILLRHRLAQTVESRVCVEPLQGHACGVAITANYAALPIATDREAPPSITRAEFLDFTHTGRENRVAPVDEEESSPDTIALEQGRQQRAEIDLLKKQVSARDRRIAYLEQRMRESLVAGWQQTAEEWDKMMQDESHEKSAHIGIANLAGDAPKPFEPLQVSQEVPRHLLRRMSGHAC